MDVNPCPFCGGEAVIRVLLGKQYIMPIHKEECLMRVDTWLISERPLKKQIKAWNMRFGDEVSK